MQDTIKIPLHSLIALLRKEGYEMGTSTMLDLQRIVANVNNENIQNAAALKYLLAPVICRNKEEQQKFYKLFDGYLASINDQPLEVVAKPDTKKNRIGWVVAAIAILVSALVLIKLLPKQNEPITLGIVELNNRLIFVAGDSVFLKVDYADSLKANNYQTNWQINGPDQIQKTYSNTKKVAAKLDTSGNYEAVANTYDENKKLLVSDTTNLQVLCEPPLEVTIEGGFTDSTDGSFSVLLSETAIHHQQYSFHWTVNNIPVIGDSSMTTNLLKQGQPNIIDLKVDWPGKQLHCSVDSLTAQLDLTPPINVDITGDVSAPLILSNNYNWSNIFTSITGLLLFPLVMAGLVWWKIRKPKPILPGDENKKDDDFEKEYKGPFTIEFNNQQHKIAPDASVSLLAEVLRKRHTSDVFKLSIQKTIKSTIRRGGFPELEYQPRTQPTDFLVLLDKEYPDGHLSRLFEFVAERLKKEQVHLTVYTFSREPLLLSNKNLNHILLPVERIARLYPETMLIIFSEAEGFFRSYDVQLKNWVAEKFKSWNTKLIITPLPKKDWGAKELALYEAGFTVVPADSNAHSVISNEINQMIDRQVLKKQIVPDAYTTRQFNFNRWRQVKAYLQNAVSLNNERLNYNVDVNLMEQWVCALAVYPHIEWNVTIAIGKAFEERFSKAGHLVNFTNLLIVSRIQWMNDLQLMDSLRVEMLNHLEPVKEAVARAIVVDLLQEIKSNVTTESLVKDELDFIDNSNKFLLNAHDPVNSFTGEEWEQFKKYVDNDQVDWTLNQYLEKGNNTLLKNPDNPHQTLSLHDYLNVRDKKAVMDQPQANQNPFDNIKVLLKKLAPAAAFCATILLSFILLKASGKLHWTDPHKKVDISFVVANSSLPLNALKLSTSDSLIVATATDSSTFLISNLTVADTAVPATVQVSTNEGDLEKQVKLASSRFTIKITHIPFTPDTTNPVNQLSEIPELLHEIWTVQNVYEMMFFDLKNQNLYYYNRGRIPITQIKMVEASKLQQGAYRVILQYASNNIYEAIFIRNITATSFDWGVCNTNTFANINDARKVSVNECRQFVKASLLYSNGSRYSASSPEFKIDLPVNNLKLVSSETQKLAIAKRKVNTFTKANQGTISAAIQINTFNKTARELLVRRAEIFSSQIMNGLNYDKNGSRTFSGNAFQRDYVTIKFSSQPVPDKMDCNRTFKSLKEALSVNPQVICKLDLSNAYLSSIPAEVFSFINIQEINLSGNNIRAAEINRLKSRFPKISIINNNNNNVEQKPDVQQSPVTQQNNDVRQSNAPAYQNNPNVDLSSVLRTAASQVGVKENPPGSNRGKEIEMYNSSAGLPAGVSWNASFVYWCYEQAGGANLLQRTGSAIQMWNTLASTNKLSSDVANKQPGLIKPGNVFFIRTGTGTGHVGIVVSVEKNSIQTIEGNANIKGANYGEGVLRMTRKISSINLGFSNFKDRPAATAQ